MQLQVPSDQFQESYKQYIKELGSEERYPFPLDFDYSDFDAYLSKVEDFEIGRNLPRAYVQSTTRWLILDDEIVGVTNMRHHLNESILRCGGHIGLSIRPSQRGNNLGTRLMAMSINYLRDQLSVGDIHIHCHKSNVASSKAIIACGGVLDSDIDDNGHIVERYIVSA